MQRLPGANGRLDSLGSPNTVASSIMGCISAARPVRPITLHFTNTPSFPICLTPTVSASAPESEESELSHSPLQPGPCKIVTAPPRILADLDSLRVVWQSKFQSQAERGYGVQEIETVSPYFVVKCNDHFYLHVIQTRSLILGFESSFGKLQAILA